MAKEPHKPTDLILEGMTDCGGAVQSLAERAWRGAAGLVRRNGPTAVSWVGRRWRNVFGAAVELARGGDGASADEPAPDRVGPVDSRVERLWAGLLAAPESPDQGDLIYEHLLAQLTTAEARVLDFACRTSIKVVSPAGLITARPLLCACDRLQVVSGTTDLHQLDRDLDHMRSLELLSGVEGGFDAECRERIANITPTALALNLYVRCQGSTLSPIEFFDLG